MMYYLAKRNIKLGSGVEIMAGHRVPDSVPEYIVARYVKLDLFKVVYDTVDECEYKAELCEYAEAIEEYKLGKEQGIRGTGIRALATKYEISERAFKRALQAKGLL